MKSGGFSPSYGSSPHPQPSFVQAGQAGTNAGVADWVVEHLDLRNGNSLVAQLPTRLAQAIAHLVIPLSQLRPVGWGL